MSCLSADNMSLLIRKQEMDTKTLTRLLEMKKDELDHLKTRMEVVSNFRQSVASSGNSRLHNVEKSGQDLRIRQSDLEKNTFSMIAALQCRYNDPININMVSIFNFLLHQSGNSAERGRSGFGRAGEFE